MIHTCHKCLYATLDVHTLRCGQSDGKPCLSLTKCPLGLAVPVVVKTPGAFRKSPGSPRIVVGGGCGGCGGPKQGGETSPIAAE